MKSTTKGLVPWLIFAVAFATGGKEITKVQRNKVLEVTTTAIKRQIDMMSKAISVLNIDQRKAIQVEYPLLLSHLWVRSGNPSSFQIGKKERKIKKKAVKKHEHSH